MLGDNAYESGTDEEFQNYLLKICMKTGWSTVSCSTAIGNHETITANSPTQSYCIMIFSPCLQTERREAPFGNRSYFLRLRQHPLCSPGFGRYGPLTWLSMLTWLATDSSPIPASIGRLLYFHHPPYSTNGSDLSSQQTQVRQNFLPVLENHGVDLVLVGHVHNYQRSYLINEQYHLSTTWDPATWESTSAMDGWMVMALI